MPFPATSPVQRSAEVSVRTALYDLLHANLGLPVFDHVPEGQELDYVVIGESSSTPWNTWTTTGEAMTDIERLLTTGGLQLQDNFVVCVLAVSERRLARNPDGKTRPGSISVTVKIQDTSVK